MTVGESIKIHRTKAGLTQKELSEKLNVSFQTISKWENDTNEPDLNTLKAMSNIFRCSVDELINNSESIESSEEDNEEVEVVRNPQVTKIQLATCRDCGKPIYSGEPIHHMQRYVGNNLRETVDVCESCYKRHQELIQELGDLLVSSSKKETKEYKGPFKKVIGRPDGKIIAWSIIIGLIVFIATLVIFLCCKVNVAASILLPLLLGYATFADIYCICSESWISDVFLEVASWSIRLPGIIFTFDLEGLKFLIFMKILFAILSVILTLAVLALAAAISAFFSIFAFPFVLMHNKKNY